MNEPASEGAVTEPVVESALRGKTVVTDDDVELGEVDGETDTHLRVRAVGSDIPGGQLWLPKAMVREVAGDTITLSRARADLHDAVLAMPPGQQHEYGTLGLSLHLGRMRGLGHTGR
jgi:hypothetical protein